MTQHFFITGASGFIGSHVVKALLDEGVQVSALYRKQPKNIDARVNVVLGSLEEAASYQSRLSTVTHVVHAAGDARFANGQEFYASNRDATRTLVNAIKDSGAPLERIVFLSTFGAVDRAGCDDCSKPVDEHTPCNPTTDYGKSKLEAECVIMQSGLPYTILRPALVVGKGMRMNSHCAVFARMALRGSPIAWLRWPGEFSVIGIADTVDAILHSARSDKTVNQTFMLGGDKISLAEIFDAAKPGWRIPLLFTQRVARAVRGILPFSVKSLLLPALVASDGRLRKTGWYPKQRPLQALAPVIAHAQLQSNVDIAPPGRTIITGAASGYGRALAERLAGMKRDIVLVDYDAAGLATCCANVSGVQRITCDLSDPKAREDLINSTAWQEKPIAELFLIAGIGSRGAFADTPLVAQQRVLDVNVDACLHLAHAAIPDMRDLQFGRIVVANSSSAFQPLPLMAIYAASKAAVLSWAEALGAELSAEGIDVISVCPGGMQTKFQSSSGVREVKGEKLQSPDDVAAMTIRHMAYGTHTFYTAFRAFAMAMLARGLPRKLNVTLWHKMMTKLR